MELTVIEIVGNSNVYIFDDTKSDHHAWWKCLFPHQVIDEIRDKDIAKKLYKALEEVNPDVVVAGPIAFPCGAISLRWANHHHKKMITFDDVKVDNVKRNGLVNFVKRKLYDRVDGYFAPSKSYVSDLKHWNFQEENIFVGLNCIDNQFFSKKENAELTKHTFEGILLGANQKYLICVARMVPVKNHRGLLMAWQHFVKRHNSTGLWHLLLVGDGPLENELKRFAAENEIPFVTFKGAVLQPELPFYYSISSAAILPSFSESWGLVVNEAMAAGLPVLVSDQCNCAKDLICENENGYTFSPDDTESIVEALTKMFHQSDLPAMGQKSLRIIENYDLKFFSKNLVSGIKALNDIPVKKASLVSSVLINLWNGKFNINGFNEKFVRK